MPRSPNTLLSSLSDADYKQLEPLLATVSLRESAVLAETGGTIEHVYFPHSGIISLVVETPGGELIETAMIGRDGVWGAACAFDGKVSINKSIVQIAGSASVIRTDDFRSYAADNDSFQSLLISHEQFLFAATQQTAACNALHSVEARLCRWLLQMRKLTGTDDLAITQEFLAQMLGVRRTSVSLIAGNLQRQGLIKYNRGHLHISDADRLAKTSCECFEAIQAHYTRLMG
jgi:CRP-like cAMP-binding protein